MCDKESFAKIREQTEANTKQIADLAKSDAVQSEQIKTLFHTTERQGDNQLKLVNRLVIAVIVVLILTVLALVFGALGEKGFNAVTRAATDISAVASREASALPGISAANNNNNRKENKK